MEFRCCSFPLSTFSKAPFPFVSVKRNFESSVKIPFPLMTLCFRVNPYFQRYLLTQRAPSEELRAYFAMLAQYYRYERCTYPAGTPHEQL